VVLVRAADLGKTGHEPAAHYLADTAFMTRLERLRVAAGRAMGFPDAAERVIPKPVLLAAAAEGGTLRARYFTPHECHKALAIGGAVAIATAVATPGTIAAALAGPARPPTTVDIEHPSGRLPVRLATRPGDGVPVAGVVRTARRLFEGRVLVRLADLVTARAAA
jgi:2-methylaconitate cis-trans-isomerase PrpF